MGQFSKRRKLAIQRYPCHTCLSDRASSLFPDYNPTATCDHLINTCKQCLRQWIESHMVGKAFTPNIQCPQCNEKMTRNDIEMAVTNSVFKKLADSRLPIVRSRQRCNADLVSRYDMLERKYVAENTPGWRWCLAVDCRAGQIHESPKPEEAAKTEESPKSTGRRWVKKLGLKKSKSKSTKSAEPKPDICVCKECGAQACVACDRPWHENESCAEYQARIKDRLEEEDKSLVAIQQNSRKCPKCSKNIEKNGGCRHMFCKLRTPPKSVERG
ncbi:hypothetical protein Q7P37_009562 [Cladosporium fusiforme]